MNFQNKTALHCPAVLPSAMLISGAKSQEWVHPNSEKLINMEAHVLDTKKYSTTFSMCYLIVIVSFRKMVFMISTSILIRKAKNYA